MSKTLGLDLGTNSIGWAITEKNENEYKLLDKGVNIFQEGVNRTKSGEEPMVKIRTDARALRRHYFRRRLRKITLLKVLIEHKLCPYLSDEQLNEWRYAKKYPLDQAFMAWQRTDEDADKNPYHDRYTALTQSLDLQTERDRYILGRALYHINQRRGFLSNRKDQGSADDGKVKDAINELTAEMEAAGCTYLGEFFYKLHQNHEKIRSGEGYGYTDRNDHYLKEFEAICEKQNLNADLRKALHRAIFFQRPLKSQKGLVGTCVFERGKARCPISHPRFEEFRMWSFVNNIKIKGPMDETLRPLNSEERKAVLPLFFRKSKEHFDFEEIAKTLSGGKKGSYAHISDRGDAPYKFNFKMSQTVSGCPTTAALKDILDPDGKKDFHADRWLPALCEVYAKGQGKTEEQILNDVWHTLFSFNDNERLEAWGTENLQLSPEQAKAFVNVPIKQGYAALSLNALNKILPYLHAGYRYDEAVFAANLPKVVPAHLWNDEATRQAIINDVCTELDNYAVSAKDSSMTKKQRIDSMLLDNYDIGLERSQYLYEPSRTETYAKAQPNEQKITLLGSPRTSSVRNPMAMRALFRLRSLINQLIKEGKIDSGTKINIELARGLNDANMRAAIERFQRENEKAHKTYADEIRKLYKAETGQNIEPTDDDILKYKLWMEQNKICLYTGREIGISQFLGADPIYDIEHTVPRSRGGDNSQMNKTLCQADFNRRIKREKLPSQLDNHAEILARIEQLGWADQIKDLESQIAKRAKASKAAATKDVKDRAISDKHYLRMRLDYLRGKLQRFEMTEVPEGFSNRQGVDIGIIGRYAKMYLETVFRYVYPVKGSTTADFRKMWGLQEEYTKKERVNHVHHCIDAITIACIDGVGYRKWAQYQRDTDNHAWNNGLRPEVEKPWPTFTEDVKAVTQELLIAHHTAHNLPKHSRKKLRVRGVVQCDAQDRPLYTQGDTARGALHMQTFYGAIERDGEIKYVVRKPISALQESDLPKIVDDAVRTCIKDAVDRLGFKEAIAHPICFNKQKGVYIKKVRMYASVSNPIHLKAHRDASRHEYKRNMYVANDSNYCMALYEGTDAKGRTKRSFQIVNNLEAALFYNGKTSQTSLVPATSKEGLALKCILRTGTMVLFYEHKPEELYECSKEELVKRMYKVIGMSEQIVSGKYHYGTFTLKHCQEARPSGELKAKGGDYTIGEDYRPIIGIKHTQLNALVENYDFTLTVTGEIKFKP